MKFWQKNYQINFLYMIFFAYFAHVFERVYFEMNETDREERCSSG